MSEKSKKPDAKIFKLRCVRLSYPNLWKARAFEEGDKEKFGCSLLWPDTEKRNAEIRVGIRKIIKAAKREAFGEDETKWPKGRQLIFDGSEKEDDAGYKGHLYISPKNERQPAVFDQDQSIVSSANGPVYAGCFVNAVVRAYAYAAGKKYKTGVSLSLEMIQKHSDGEKFASGGVDPTKYLEDIEDESEDESNYDKDDESGTDEKDENDSW